jgi:tetraacyldisaccharide 4'-kinase
VLSYPDHHYFLSKDLEEIKSTYDNWQVPDKVIVTTEKDATRLHLQQDKIRAWNIPVVVLPIAVFVLFNEGINLDYAIRTYVAKTLQDDGFGPTEEKKEDEI